MTYPPMSGFFYCKETKQGGTTGVDRPCEDSTLLSSLYEGGFSLEKEVILYMGGKEVGPRPGKIMPVQTMEIYPLPEPKGQPKITDEHFKTIRPRRHPLGQAIFGIYGDPGR